MITRIPPNICCFRCGACAWLQLQVIQFCACADRGSCWAVSSQCSIGRDGRRDLVEQFAWIPLLWTQLDDLLALKVSIVDKSGFFLGPLSGVVIVIGDS